MSNSHLTGNQTIKSLQFSNHGVMSPSNII